MTTILQLVLTFLTTSKDLNATTIANMLRYYSPNIAGPSVGTNLITLCFRKLISKSNMSSAKTYAAFNGQKKAFAPISNTSELHSLCMKM
jgi:hypothetical protein